MEKQLTQSWLHSLSDHNTQAQNVRDNPNYWARDASTLRSTSNIHNLDFGTGASIYDALSSAIDATSQELILVTCFWARSETLDTFNQCLRALSSKGQNAGKKIRVRICFSSSSLFQKLFHPSTPHGKIYPSGTWSGTLGLPESHELPGLDMQVKSIFFLPIGIIHPKFIIVDRKYVFVPSCNISWENWFEGCISLSGPIVGQFVQYWSKFWVAPGHRDTELSGAVEETEDIELHENERAAGSELGIPARSHQSFSNLLVHATLGLPSIPTIFLPSSHHINPRFRFPWQAHAPAPPTPLNTFLLSAMKHAEQQIYIQTPNLTSPPVLHALLDALRRGVNVRILTSERLMILEQLVTAGTTTSRCVKTLISRYERLRNTPSASRESLVRAEEGRLEMGELTIAYYEPRRGLGGKTAKGEPVQSHLKLTIVDEELVVLGSGNMDRASWYTSQELGVAFFSKELSSSIKDSLEQVMEGRRRVAFDSSTGS
ncbi:hypothetical protein MBLNU459_g0763t1 [Dothideomycetes sp. NU459]